MILSFPRTTLLISAALAEKANISPDNITEVNDFILFSILVTFRLILLST